MENTNSGINKISGFLLKVFAMITMTFDHVGLFLQDSTKTYEIGLVFRAIGRLAFPIFIFLIVEGIRYTKNIKKYLLRLSLLALVFFIGQIGYYYILGIKELGRMVSPAVDLILVAVLVYLLNRKDKFSWFAILPISYGILSFFVQNIEIINRNYIEWFPFFLRADYSIFGVMLGVGFYYANDIAKSFLESNALTHDFVGTTYEKITQNLISAIVLLFTTIILNVVATYTPFKTPGEGYQIYACLSALPIIFYSGKRGYNKPWFKYFCYIYFPAHLVVIFLIFSLI